MEQSRPLSLTYASSLSALTERNSSFDSGELRVCYTGKNRNNSFISRKTIEQNIDTLYNCPIVCNYDRESDTIGSHDMELVNDDRGMRLVNMTDPVGVVPQGAQYRWREIEDDGGIHEYLCVDVLLWKRQEAYNKIKDDGIVAQSMEINVQDGKMVDGVFHIDRFEFTALCLLGTAEPCFEGASLEVFSKNEFREQMSQMVKEYKELMSDTPPGVDDKENFTKGGDQEVEEKVTLMEKFGLTEEQLDFKVDDFTVEELEAKFEEMTKQPEEDPEPTEPKFALAGNMLDNMLEALYAETYETEWGTMRRYFYVDHDPDIGAVYAEDSQDWKLYGFNYTLDGDNVVIDFASCKRKKFDIVDFDEGEQASATAGLFELMTEKFTAMKSDLEEKVDAEAKKFSDVEDELTELRQFKTNAEKIAADAEREQVFDKFEDLNGVEAFEALRGEAENYSVEDLEEKCFAIRGRNMSTQKFSMQEIKTPKIPVVEVKTEEGPYGGLFDKYGNKD